MKLPCLLVAGNRRLHAGADMQIVQGTIDRLWARIKDAITMAKKVAEQVENENGHRVATVTTADHGNACQSGETYA